MLQIEVPDFSEATKAAAIAADPAYGEKADFLWVHDKMSDPRITLYRRKIKAYRWLYEFTRSQCQDCARTDCACKDTICSHVQTQAKAMGVDLKPTGHRLRFIGCGGCIVAPHLRETCTIYLCEKAQSRPDFERERYERLKSLCAKIEMKLMESEPG